MNDKQKYAIKVTWRDGEEDFAREGIAGERIVAFSSLESAKDKCNSILEEMEVSFDLYKLQSITVVPYPLEKFSL